MKKFLVFVGVLLCTGFISCNKNQSTGDLQQDIQSIVETENGMTITSIPAAKGISILKKSGDYTNVIEVKPGLTEGRNPISLSLQKFSGKLVMIEFSCKMKVQNKKEDKTLVSWVVDEPLETLPVVASDKLKNKEWTTLKGRINVELSDNRSLYLSGGGYDKDNVTFYIADLQIKVTNVSDGEKLEDLTGWYDSASIKDAYKGIFDYFGLTVTYNGEFTRPEVQKGVMRQADCITFGNELKPDFIFDWQKVIKQKDFRAEDGKDYKVPDGIPTYNRVNAILTTAKECNLMVRGHVLVWHSQTPDWFFKEDYQSDKPFVDKATMNARMEWYIKSLLEYVAEWEKKNNNGKHIIFAWDVVNEACSDNANDTDYLRNSGSNWYSVYQDDSFIINAFRYANKYAPKDVLLVYNDYNSYQTAKTKAILKIVDKIQKTPDARIDAVGMQSHVRIDYPSVSLFEKAVQEFLKAGVNVQITELDVANGKESYNPIDLKERYQSLFEMFIRNRKTDSKNGISGVTIWGLADEQTWLNDLGEYKGHKQFPLLFRETKDGNFKCKGAFDGVIEAASQAK